MRRRKLIGVTLDLETIKTTKELAKSDHRSVSNFIEVAILEKIEKINNT